MGLFKKSSTQTKEPTTEWPPVNELVWIRLPCCETSIHPSRVEDKNGNDLIVAHPSKPHPEPLPLPNPDKLFTIGWREGVASKQVRVKFRQADAGDVPTWTLRAEGPAELVQRRRFVRAEWDNDISFHFPMDTVHGKIIDLSEGGLRCSLPAMNEPRSPYFQVSFILEEEQLLLDCEIAWWGEPVDGNVQVALQFVAQPAPLADRLRAFTFAQQLEQRKAR